MPRKYTITIATAPPANANHTYAQIRVRPTSPIATVIASAAPAFTPRICGSPSGLFINRWMSSPPPPAPRADEDREYCAAAARPSNQSPPGRRTRTAPEQGHPTRHSAPRRARRRTGWNQARTSTTTNRPTHTATNAGPGWFRRPPRSPTAAPGAGRLPSPGPGLLHPAATIWIVDRG